MRLRKVVNRVYEGTTYYRWVVSLPPKDIRDLGWVDGQELQTIVRGSTLLIEPSVHGKRTKRSPSAESLESEVQRRSVARR